MGGEITNAVEEVRGKGLIVVSLNMAGSVPDAADLVVTDPVQAGVMAVMAVADTAKFDIVRQQKRKYSAVGTELNYKSVRPQINTEKRRNGARTERRHVACATAAGAAGRMTTEEPEL